MKQDKNRKIEHLTTHACKGIGCSYCKEVKEIKDLLEELGGR